MISELQKEYLLPKACNAAVRAGRAILDIYASPERTDFDVKKDNTPITVADRLSHEIIKRYLSQTRIPILSEEGRDMLFEERKDWDLFWMVDPLDGTKEFIKGNGEFTVNIALMVDNRPLLGVVYVPYIGRIYFNDPAKGSFRRDGVKAEAEAEYLYDDLFYQCATLPLAREADRPLRVAVSRSHNTPETFAAIDLLRASHPDLELIEQGSSYKFCMIAEGTVDYYVRTSDTYEWDTAAGEAVLAAAGGQTLCHPELARLTYNKPSLINPHFVCMRKGFE